MVPESKAREGRANQWTWYRTYWNGNFQIRSDIVQDACRCPPVILFFSPFLNDDSEQAYQYIHSRENHVTVAWADRVEGPTVRKQRRMRGRWSTPDTPTSGLLLQVL